MANSSYRAKSESRFIVIVGLLVVLIGIPSVMSVMMEPNQEALVKPKTESRAPASAGADGVVNEPINEAHSHTTALLNMDCQRTDMQDEVQATLVRLSGVPCDGTEDLEIVNTTNGFSASVIFTKGHKFTTDFIDLKDGENNLEITSIQEDGTKV